MNSSSTEVLQTGVVIFPLSNESEQFAESSAAKPPAAEAIPAEKPAIQFTAHFTKLKKSRRKRSSGIL